MTTGVLELKGISKTFGGVASVVDCNFVIRRGSITGLVGPNGAGKSTTMKMVTGYLPISSGEATVCGYNIEHDPLEAKTKVGYLPEGAPLYGDMTTIGFLNFAFSNA